MEKHWLKQYDPDVPHSLMPYPERTLLDVVHDTALQRPDHPALLFKGARLSYGNLERLSNAFAAALVAQGIQKGDRVALLLPNCPQFVIAQLGAWKAGAVVVPLNTEITAPQLTNTLDGIESVALIASSRYERLLRHSQLAQNGVSRCPPRMDSASTRERCIRRPPGNCSSF